MCRERTADQRGGVEVALLHLGNKHVGLTTLFHTGGEGGAFAPFQKFIVADFWAHFHYQDDADTMTYLVKKILI